MTSDPASSSIDLRPDIAEGHSNAWRHIARPGAWWSSAERIAIAHASRNAWDCQVSRDRKAALSPAHVQGEILRTEADSVLSEDVVDTVYRLVTDPARLTRGWLEELIDRGALTHASYVELIGVVTQALSMDVLRLALGQPLDEIPEPETGEPSHYEPPGLAMEEAWVPMIKRQNLGPEEQDLYGKTGNVIRALSAVPEEVRALKRLSSHHYLSIEAMSDFVGGESVGRSIDRAQMELVAGRVSALHECFY